MIAHHERKTGECQLSLTTKEKPENANYRSTGKKSRRNANFVRFYDKNMHNFHMDQSIKQSEFR